MCLKYTISPLCGLKHLASISIQAYFRPLLKSYSDSKRKKMRAMTDNVTNKNHSRFVNLTTISKNLFIKPVALFICAIGEGISSMAPVN
jgi:hypothetical protein